MTVPKSFRKRPPKGCVLHKGALASADYREFAVFIVTTPLRTLEDLAGDPSMPREQFERAVKDATARGLIRKSASSHLLAQRRDRSRRKSGEA